MRLSRFNTRDDSVDAIPSGTGESSPMTRSDILVGTSGFSFSDWKGPVYPASLPSSEWLSWYAARLRFVELNVTYYRMPDQRFLQNLLERVPARFRFAIKAHRSLTHEVSADWGNDLETFRSAIKPIAAAGRLAATLFQFPYRFHYTEANRRYLAALCEAASDITPAIEFRHAEWFRESVYDGLRRRGATLVWPDLPRLRNLPDLRPVVTSSLGYLRLHGRNSQTWWNGTNESRYHYRYSDDELRELQHEIAAVLPDLETLLVAFNNHFEGNAFFNALAFDTMLRA